MYIPFDKFAYRTSLLPAEGENYSDDLNKLLESGFYKDVIYISSTDLISALNKVKDKKKETKLGFSLLKYFLRSKFRCTPFGLLASIGIGSINSDKSGVSLSHFSEFRRNTRLDMNCICALLQELAKKEFIKKYLKFYPNNSLYSVGDKLRYAEYYYLNNNRRHILTGVETNEYIDSILSAATQGASIPDLINSISDEDIETDEKLLFIEELIHSQILVSELEPSVTGPEMEEQALILLTRILDKTDNEEDKLSVQLILEKIKQIREILRNIDNLGISDENIANYLLVEQLIGQLGIPYEKKFLFQSDLVAKAKTATLNKSIADKALKGADVLSRFTTTISKTSMNVFKDAFYERWEEEEVPLVLALDSDQGIGYLQNLGERVDIAPLVDDLVLPYTFPDEQKVEFSGRLFQFWHNKYTEAVKNDSYEIVLEEKDIEKLPSKLDQLADSFSILMSVLEPADENGTDENRIYLKAVGGSCSSYLFGRFCHDDTGIYDFTKEMIDKEENLYKDRIIAEIIHLPESRTGNVIFRPVMRKYEIPYLAKSGVPREYQIAITDLMVSIRNNRIFLRSKKLDKEITPRLTTAHNFSHNSLPLYQFLGDLQNQDCLWGVQTDLGVIFSNSNFIPRISFKKDIILHPAKWQLRKSDIKMLVECKESELLKTFDQFKKKWKLPEYFALMEADNELVINTRNEESIRLFVNEIRAKEFISLIEFYFDSSQSLISSGAGRHPNEIIVSYYRDQVKQPESTDSPAMKDEKIERRYLPGDEWLYFKIYAGYKTADEILTKVVKPLTDDLLYEDKISKWFFIRYVDPKFHIRFRLLLKDKKHCGDIILLVNEALKPFRESGAVWNLQLDSYKRELERYGNEYMEQAETIFFRDSEAVVSILDIIEGEEGEKIKWLAVLKSVDEYLNAFGFSIEEKQKYIDELRGYFAIEFSADKDMANQLDKKFRKSKNIIEQWLSDDTEENQIILSNYFPVFDLLSQRTEKLNPSIKVLFTRTDNKIIRSWLASFLHMNVNRFFRSKNRLHEYVIYDLLEKHYRYKCGKMKALKKNIQPITVAVNEAISNI